MLWRRQTCCLPIRSWLQVIACWLLLKWWYPLFPSSSSGHECHTSHVPGKSRSSNLHLYSCSPCPVLVSRLLTTPRQWRAPVYQPQLTPQLENPSRSGGHGHVHCLAGPMPCLWAGWDRTGVYVHPTGTSLGLLFQLLLGPSPGQDLSVISTAGRDPSSRVSLPLSPVLFWCLTVPSVPLGPMSEPLSSSGFFPHQPFTNWGRLTAVVRAGRKGTVDPSSKCLLGWCQPLRWWRTAVGSWRWRTLLPLHSKQTNRQTQNKTPNPVAATSVLPITHGSNHSKKPDSFRLYFQLPIRICFFSSSFIGQEWAAFSPHLWKGKMQL